MKKIAILISVILVAVLLTACGTTTNTPAASNNGNTNTASQTNTVTIQNFAFNPATLTVKAGTTVTWTNKDSTTHKIKSDTFNSGDLNQNDTFQFQFNNTGTFNYSCAIHPSMTGQIIVE